MKIFRNKKGLDFAILLVIVVLICLGFLFWQLYSKSQTIERDIGDAQIGLMLVQQNADKTMFYLDQAAKYSAYDSALKLGVNGGLADVSKGCGQANGIYSLWTKCESPDNLDLCYPDFYESFKELMNTRFNDYLDDSSEHIGLRDNFIFSYVDGKLVGMGVNNIESTVTAYQPKARADPNVGMYSFKPSFSIDFSYDFEKYFRLRELAEKIIVCAKTSSTIPARNQCLAGFSEAGITILVPDNKYILVTAAQPGFASPFSPQSETVIRFALCYPPVPSTPVVAAKPQASLPPESAQAGV